MVQLISQRMRLPRNARLWLRKHGLRARPFKHALLAYLQLDGGVQLQVRHHWVEHIGAQYDGQIPERFHCGLPVVIDYRLLPTLLPGAGSGGRECYGGQDLPEATRH